MKWQKLDNESAKLMKTDKSILMGSNAFAYNDIIRYKNWNTVKDIWYSLMDEEDYDINQLMKEYSHFCLIDEVDQPERASEKTPEKEMRCAEPDGNTGR